MPLINGVKMACEPCIRGHRSTKCTHASERLMVPVRKPGRPLSSCPHPASKSCTCAALMAAIPKSQKCPCATAEEAAGRKAAAETADREPSNGMVTPPSPAPKGTSAAPAYRVQKANSKNGPAKKQIDPANIERMDVNQLNVLSPSDLKSPLSPTNGNMPTTPITAFPSYGMMGFIPNGNAFSPNPAMFPLYQQLASANPAAGPAATKPMAPNGHPLVNGHTVVAAKSCCGPAKPTLAQPNEQLALKANGTNGVENQPKSCCSSKAEKSETKPQERMPTSAIAPQANGMVMPQFTNVPMGMPNGLYPYFAQPAIFAYPPQYGSYMQPLQPDQWRQLMTALSYGQQQQPTNGQQNIPYSAPAPVPAVPAPSQQFPQTSSSEADSTWTAHHCSCGEGCQCIGCATHPYNTATQNYVRSAWNSMAEDSPKRHRHSDSVSTPSINGSYEMPTPSGQSPIGGSTPVMAKMEETASPSTAHTPSDATSTLGEEMGLSANDFFFVSYPFGDICEGEMANCPCGDGCQCIGCAIHVTVQHGP